MKQIDTAGRQQVARPWAAGSRAILGLAAVHMMLLAGCGGSPLAPSPPQPFAATLTVQAAAEVNPDAQGRASPVFVRLYQLKDAGAFNNASYDALQSQEAATLGDSVMVREELPLALGASQELQLKIEPQTRFIGVIADCRDIPNARWRAVTSAPEKRLRD